MTSPSTTHWVRAGLILLPVYGLLTAWSSLKPQPDQVTDTAAWAEFVSTPAYLTSHVIGSTGGTILAIFGVFALGVYLARGRAARLAIPAMVLTVLAHSLMLVPSAISTFATPAVGRAYLDGVPGVMELQFPDALTYTFILGLLLALVGNVLLGVAVWRSWTLTRWAGALWIAAAVVFYPLGVMLGMATTGSSLPTQSIGALLAAVSGAWIAAGALRAGRTDDRTSEPLTSRR
jgi:hypothetical protein